MAIHECYPYLRVSDGHAALAFYQKVFGAKVTLRLIDPADGRVGHAEVQLAPGVVFMVSDAYPEYGIGAPSGPQGAGIHLHVDDADAVIAAAVEAGATLVRPAADQFYGERTGTFLDPFGHSWMVGHNVEKVADDEMQRRWDAMVKG